MTNGMEGWIEAFCAWLSGFDPELFAVLGGPGLNPRELHRLESAFLAGRTSFALQHSKSDCSVSESVREQQHQRREWSDACEAAWFKWSGTQEYAALLTSTPIKDRPVGVRFAQAAFHAAFEGNKPTCSRCGADMPRHREGTG